LQEFVKAILQEGLICHILLSGRGSLSLLTEENSFTDQFVNGVVNKEIHHTVYKDEPPTVLLLYRGLVNVILLEIQDSHMLRDGKNNKEDHLL
jgi:hypothetical protein